MNEPNRGDEQKECLTLGEREERLVQALRLLQQVELTAFDQVETFVWSLVGRHLKWSYDDPASLRRAAEFAALDPCLRREVEAIQEEFAPTESDGLGEY